jgi:sugar phosphate permease
MPTLAKIEEREEQNKEKLEYFQKWVFLSTFMNYAMAHWTRK